METWTQPKYYDFLFFFSSSSIDFFSNNFLLRDFYHFYLAFFGVLGRMIRFFSCLKKRFPISQPLFIRHVQTSSPFGYLLDKLAQKLQNLIFFDSTVANKSRLKYFKSNQKVFFTNKNASNRANFSKKSRF